MYKEQVLPTNLNEFYRCGERVWLQTDDEKRYSPIQKMDATLEEKINHALWEDDVLRVTDNNEINIHVKKCHRLHERTYDQHDQPPAG